MEIYNTQVFKSSLDLFFGRHIHFKIFGLLALLLHFGEKVLDVHLRDILHKEAKAIALY